MRAPDRRTLLIGTLAVTLVAAAVLAYTRLRPESAELPVPTVPVANTQTNIGCIDETGTDTAAIGDWYRDDAGGSLVLTGELTASLGLGAFSNAATKAVAAVIGTFTTSEVRDLAPTLTACVTMRYAGYELEGGAEIEVIAWRVVSATSPMWVPNEAAFVPLDDTTLVSEGEHLVNTLTVAPDGTTVLVAAFGPGARELLTGIPGAAVPPGTGASTTGTAAVGAAPATSAQLAEIGAAVLQQVLTR